MKNKILFSAMAAGVILCNTAFADINISSGVLDNDFSTGRTLYYVEVAENKIPTITMDGYTLVKNATEVYTGGALLEKHTTVLKDSQNKLYRFVISKKGGTAEIAAEDGITITPQGKLTVKGAVEGLDKVQVFILKPTEAYSDNAYTWADVKLSEMHKTVLDIKEVKASDIKGGVILKDYAFPASAVSGQYGVLITGEGIAQSAYATKYYSSQKEINGHISQVNEKSQFSDTKPVSDLRDYVEKNSKGLQLDMTHYNKLGTDKDEGRDIAISLMKSTGNYSSLEDIGEAFYKGVAIGTANEGKSLNDVLAAYDQYLNLELYDEYKALADDSAVEASLKGVTTIDEMRKGFNKHTVISMINEAEPSSIETIMKDNISYLDLPSDVKTYYENNVDDCVTVLGNKNFLDVNGIEEAINGVKNGDQGGDADEEDTVSASKPSGTVGYVASPNNKGGVTSGNTAGTGTQPGLSAGSMPFTDIANVSWAHKAMEYLYNNKILNGKSASIFAPNDYIKREEFVKLIVNSFALDSTKDVAFKDVQKGAWYESFIKTAYASGVVNGVSAEIFGVGQYITREDMAVMIYRAVEASGMNTEIIIDNPPKLTDLDSVSEYAKEAVNFMIEKGAVNGIDGKFMPKAYATRAQTAQMLYQIIKIR